MLTHSLLGIEDALEKGNLWVLMNSGRYRRLRRNGATKRWKTRPADFRLPVKAGLKSCGAITQLSVVGDRWSGTEFVVSETDPNSPSDPRA